MRYYATRDTASTRSSGAAPRERLATASRTRDRARGPSCSDPPSLQGKNGSDLGMAPLEHDVRASRTRIRCPRRITRPPRLDDVRGRPRLGRDSRYRAGAAARVLLPEEPLEGSAIAVRVLPRARQSKARSE